ncbi:MAG: hypothetical protein ABJB97_03790 [Acidobacteriota bacterium]
MKGSHIKLHIEELSLHGFAPGDRYAIADAVEQELSRLLIEHFAEPRTSPLWNTNTDTARLDAGAFQVAPSSAAKMIGSQIAQAVHGGVDQ